MASKSVEDFLNNLELELNKYAKSLRDQGFTLTNMLTFLKLKDLQSIPFVVPAPHRSMEVNFRSKVHFPRQSIIIRAKREK